MTVHVLTRSAVGPRVNTYAQPRTGDPEGALPDRVFMAGQERAFLAGLDFLVLALPHTREREHGRRGGAAGAAPHGVRAEPGAGADHPGGSCCGLARLVAGAALDTHFAYPLPPGPLWRLPNVILTPHVSGPTSKAFPAAWPTCSPRT